MSKLPPRFAPLFDALKIPQSSYDTSSTAALHALRPLATPNPAHEFCFERYQHTALGDAVIRRAISKQVSTYFLRRSSSVRGGQPVFTASYNTTRHLVACFHNALSVRYVAEKLPLAVVAADDKRRPHGEADGNDDDDEADLDLLGALAQATTPRRGPVSRHDRRGTSFDWLPHSFAQCDLAPRLSHFIGCLDLYASRQVAMDAAQRAFFDLNGETGNVPYEAATVLATLCAKFPAVSVARAVLAAQGVTTQFLSRSVATGSAASSSSPSSFGAQSASKAHEKSHVDQKEDDSSSASATATETTTDVVSASNDDKNHVAAAASSNNKKNTTTVVVPKNSAALGPGRIDLISKWKEAVSIDQTHAKDKADELVDAFGGSGWESDSDNPHSKSNSFFTGGFVEPRASLADLNGTPIPDLANRTGGLDQQYVARRLNSAPVRDPSFFDKDDGRDGVSLTDGSGLPGFPAVASTRDAVNVLSQPHSRLFEVIMVRDPLVASSKLRREVYADDATGQDSGSGRTLQEASRERLFSFGTTASVTGLEEERKPSVGMRVVSRGMGASYAEARHAAALRFLEAVVADLSRT